MGALTNREKKQKKFPKMDGKNWMLTAVCSHHDNCHVVKVVELARHKILQISVYQRPSWMPKILSGSVVVTIMRTIIMMVFVVFLVCYGAQVLMVGLRKGKGNKGKTVDINRSEATVNGRS